MIENTSHLAGKAALVTGGNRGIGRTITLALAEAGADIALSYRGRESEALQVRSELESRGHRCVVMQADVSVIADVSRMIGAIEESLGGVSILVNNAGMSSPRSIEAVTEDDWDKIIAVNLKSVFLVTQAVLPYMRSQKWGRIINMTSVAIQLGSIVSPHYAASKAGIWGLTHSYASQLAGEGITVNAVAPALIDTEMVAGNPQAQPERIPVGRLGSPQEVADVVAMLACNGYITGQTINVNGGLCMS